jgi:hypothetical protein
MTPAVNPWRGEVAVTLNGQTVPARLTLGALAELETALGATSLVDLAARFEKGAFSARDVLAVLFAGLRAGGWQGTGADLAAASFAGGPLGAARDAALLLARAFAPPAP